jgi:nitrogenase molybdenum-iron protein alpha/beta subunit
MANLCRSCLSFLNRSNWLPLIRDCDSDEDSVKRNVEFHETIENRYKRSIAEIAKAATSCSLCEMVTELLKNCRRLADIAWVKPSIHVFGPRGLSR